MIRREEILTTLKRHRDELVRYGARSLRLFGSVARDEASPESDIDLLVDFATPPTFSQYMELRIRLEDLLGAKVDLVTEAGLRARVRPIVERDAILVA
jgi:predicted nucleotidyltransferase